MCHLSKLWLIDPNIPIVWQIVVLVQNMCWWKGEGCYVREERDQGEVSVGY